MSAIFKRDLASYYKTMLGYIFAAIFLVLCGFYFLINNILSYSGDLSRMFSSVAIVLIVLIPLITMRTFSEEKKSRSEQLLFTSPVSVSSIVLGKFFSALCVFLLTLAVTLVYVIAVFIWSSPSLVQIVNSYLGFILLGTAFISLGIFISSLTENQLIAAVVSIGLLLLLWMIDLLVPSITSDFFRGVVNYLSPFGHFAKFQSGLLSLSSVIYFISFTGLFLFLTARKLESKRWAKG